MIVHRLKLILGYPAIYAAVNEGKTFEWINSVITQQIAKPNMWTEWTEWTDCMCHDDQTTGKRTRKKTCKSRSR